MRQLNTIDDMAAEQLNGELLQDVGHQPAAAVGKSVQRFRRHSEIACQQRAVAPVRAQRGAQGIGSTDRTSLLMGWSHQSTASERAPALVQ